MSQYECIMAWLKWAQQKGDTPCQSLTKDMYLQNETEVTDSLMYETWKSVGSVMYLMHEGCV